MLKFTEDHEWVERDGDVATVGITAHAAKLLGDLVYVELPKVGARLSKGSVSGVVESVKTASDVYAPLDGEVIEVNQTASDDPAVVTREPDTGGWLYKMRLSNPADFEALLDADAYAKLTA